MQNLRKRLLRRPKREVSFGSPSPCVGDFHPLRTPAQSVYLTPHTNEPSERSNPSTALLTGEGNQPYAPMGRMAQEANAWGNAQDMQTWAGCSGR